jgi:hypothetical protein
MESKGDTVNAILGFWQFLYYLQHLSAQCSDIAGTPARVVYSGNCLQAFTLALFQHLAFVVLP